MIVYSGRLAMARECLRVSMALEPLASVVQRVMELMHALGSRMGVSCSSSVG